MPGADAVLRNNKPDKNRKLRHGKHMQLLLRTMDEQFMLPIKSRLRRGMRFKH